MKIKKGPSTFFVSILLVATVLGCGIIGGDKIENAVINADLGRQRVGHHRRNFLNLELLA